MMKHILNTALMAAVLGLSVTGYADSPAANEVTVEDVVAAGNGCPASDGGGLLLANPELIVIDLQAMTAELGEDVPRTERRKFCQYAIDLEFPEGWEYRVASIVGQANVSLDAESDGLVKYSSYFQGSSDTLELEKVYEGPFARTDYVFTSAASAPLSPCGPSRALNIKAQVRTSPKDNASSLATGTLTLAGPTYVQLVWQRCTPPTPEEATPDE